MPLTRWISAAGTRPLVVAAHPDDESIGLGGLLPLLREPYLIHLTGGAPRNHPDRDAYAEARERELAAALALAGIDSRRMYSLDAVDQECALDMAGLARRLASLLEEIQPHVIFTHPYEGGHPDHDAAAFIVRSAVRLLKRMQPVEEPWNRALAAIKTPPPEIIEFTCYHNADPGGLRARMRVGEFLAAGSPSQLGQPANTILLTADARDRKRSMFACFETQRQMLASFPIAIERFRIAPLYDFTRPPHPGRLFYEDQDWGMEGARWRYLASLALAELFPETETSRQADDPLAVPVSFNRR